MLLRIEGPILGRKHGDLIRVDDEQGAQYLADYPNQITHVGEPSKREPVEKPEPSRRQRAQPAVPEPTVDEVLETLNETMEKPSEPAGDGI